MSTYRALYSAVVLQALQDLDRPSQRDDALAFFRSPWCDFVAEAAEVDAENLRKRALGRARAKPRTKQGRPRAPTKGVTLDVLHVILAQLSANAEAYRRVYSGDLSCAAIAARAGVGRSKVQRCINAGAIELAAVDLTQAERQRLEPLLKQRAALKGSIKAQRTAAAEIGVARQWIDRASVLLKLTQAEWGQLMPLLKRRAEIVRQREDVSTDRVKALTGIDDQAARNMMRSGKARTKHECRAVQLTRLRLEIESQWRDCGSGGIARITGIPRKAATAAISYMGIGLEAVELIKGYAANDLDL